jgi:hypothetical protein
MRLQELSEIGCVESSPEMLSLLARERGFASIR